ncbi:MAG: macro domain-containing protein [Planctomycetaceae bacterium]
MDDFRIQYVEGDATRPITTAPWVIAHVCNDIGKWGRGFVVPLGKAWPLAKDAYLRAMSPQQDRLPLGHCQFVEVADDCWVANMIAQRGVRTKKTVVPPLRLESLGESLAAVRTFATDHGASVHMPRIGTGLAGGHWSDIERLLLQTFEKSEVPVFVYDLPR